MESNKVSDRFQKNILLSIVFTVVYIALLVIYNGMNLSDINDSLLILFLVGSAILNTAALFFAFKNYKKIISIILILFNSLGLLSVLVFLWMLVS
ncbi:hypothetical protein [Chryseobacterium sp.]|uniref:hypothetical protein n=1 Tax=Chryseobacterium sp. TaxID=1871047 RepID=UPI003341E8F8